jgi:hypothetical protein
MKVDIQGIECESVDWIYMRQKETSIGLLWTL